MWLEHLLLFGVMLKEIICALFGVMVGVLLNIMITAKNDDSTTSKKQPKHYFTLLVGKHEIDIFADTLMCRTWKDSPNPNTYEHAEAMFSEFRDAWERLSECKKAWFQAFLTFGIASGRTAWESPYIAKALNHVFGDILSDTICKEVAIAICVKFPNLENTCPRKNIGYLCCKWSDLKDKTDQMIKAKYQAQ